MSITHSPPPFALGKPMNAQDERERLLMAVVDLCEQADRTGAPLADRARAQAALQDIFLNLISSTERDLRRRLAERLSAAPWTPHGLVTILSLDDIEIARPVIAESPVLTETDLVKVLITATLEHQIEVARRPNISADVIDMIIEQSQPVVMAALADNSSADMRLAQLTRMVMASQRLAALRSPLVRHPKLTVDLAYLLYAWVGDALRKAIATRFRVDESLLQASIEDVVRSHRAGAPFDLRTRDADTETVDIALEDQLIIKLDAAGQLKPGYLMRALRERKLSLFKAALARIGGYPRDVIDLVIDTGRPDLLALACASVGIDRSVFPTVHRMVSDLQGRRSGGGELYAQETANAFQVEPSQAALLLRERAMRLTAANT
jgi:uncharacterized protein (DUF2336 family)